MYDTEEITLILTRKCNLKCQFCNVIYQHCYNNDLTSDIVISKYSYIKAIIDNTKKHHINMVLMGGELFSDDINDNVIYAYKNLIQKTECLCMQRDKTLSISIMSNLITKHVDRLINLASCFPNCDVHGSYDFVGRFNNTKLIDLWWANALKIKHAQIPFFVAMVGHKLNVERILNRDPEWELLYNEFGVYVQYYESNSIYEQYNLSYDQYRDFLLFLYNEYPKERFLQSILNAYDKGYKTCCQSNWIDNTGCHKCCNHDNVIKIYKLNHKCFACAHYQHCPVVCPRVYSGANCCVFKPLFDAYITDKLQSELI